MDLEDVAVRCTTLKEARALLSHLDNLGYKWFSGTRLTEFTAWEVCGECTVYHIREGCVTYSNACGEEYHEVDLDTVLGHYPRVTPDKFYDDILATEGSGSDGLS